MADIRDRIKTPEEAAAAIRERYTISISASTVGRWLREGRIPGQYFCGKWLVDMPGTFKILDKRANWRPNPPRRKAA